MSNLIPKQMLGDEKMREKTASSTETSHLRLTVKIPSKIVFMLKLFLVENVSCGNVLMENTDRCTTGLTVNIISVWNAMCMGVIERKEE